MKIRHPWIIYLVGRTLALVARLWSWTIRFRIVHEDPQIDLASPDCPDFHVVTLWHDALLLPIMARAKRRSRPVTALVSQHADGSYLVSFLQGIGIKAVRGSSTRGGSSAAKSLLEAAQKGHVYITPDGPLGPRRRMKDGAIYIASQSGKTILPVGAACNRAWRINAKWSILSVPKPFSTVEMIVGAPIRVPESLDRDQIEQLRIKVENEINRAQELADLKAKGIGARDEVRRKDELRRVA